MDPATMMAALGPLLVELGKNAIARWVAPDAFKPKTVDDWLRMRQADIELFRVMNEAGGSNPSYPLVEAIVRLQRPAVAGIVLGVWAGSHVLHAAGMSAGPSEAVNNFASAVGFYLFGDRTLFYVKQRAASLK